MGELDNKTTIDLLKKGLPATMKKIVPDNLLDNIQKTIQDPITREHFRENLLSYPAVMKNGRFKINSYVDAVKYVTYKLMGDTNETAYCKTFPDRINTLTVNGNIKDLSSYVTAYNKTKLVSLIMEQTLVPTWVLNQDLYQKALNVQAELMVHANSEKVRTDAAACLLNTLKKPETQKMELDLNVKEDKSIDALRESTMALVEQQKLALQNKTMGVTQVAHSELNIVEGDYDEIEESQ